MRYLEVEKLHNLFFLQLNRPLKWRLAMIVHCIFVGSVLEQ